MIGQCRMPFIRETVPIQGFRNVAFQWKRRSDQRFFGRLFWRKLIVAFGAAVVKLLRKLRSEGYADSLNAFKGCWRAKFDATVRVGNKVVEIYRVKKKKDGFSAVIQHYSSSGQLVVHLSAAGKICGSKLVMCYASQKPIQTIIGVMFLEEKHDGHPIRLEKVHLPFAKRVAIDFGRAAFDGYEAALIY